MGNDVATVDKLAQQAAEAFLSGKVIAGLGIAGVAAMVIGFFIWLACVDRDATADADSYLAAGFAFAGLVAVVFSGVLHARKARLRAEIQMSLVDGLNRVAAELAGKVKEGTVNSEELPELVRTYLEGIRPVLYE